jgi:hypothetical protein
MGEGVAEQQRRIATSRSGSRSRVTIPTTSSAPGDPDPPPRRARASRDMAVSQAPASPSGPLVVGSQPIAVGVLGTAGSEAQVGAFSG